MSTLEPLLALTCLAAAPGDGLAPHAWRPSEYPIGFWFGPLEQHNTREGWQQVADAGFTFGGMQSYGLEGNRRMLDHCAAVGLRAMLIDSRIAWNMVEAENWRETLAAVVGDYGSHPALYGYYVQDEPNSRIFGPLGQIQAELSRLDPAHPPFINLFPTYASVEQLGNPTYADHLEQYLSIVKPSFCSWDHYALMRDGRDRGDFYENFELVRAASARHGVSPWYILLSIPHFGYRDPSDGEMRWQVNTALAYGIKGLLYFTYATVPEWAAEGHVAIVDPDGRPARLYPIVQAINREVRQLGRTLLGLTSTAVYHTGEIPPGCTRLPADALVGVEGDAGLLLGCFRDAAGADWLMVVNKNHSAPVEAALRLKPHVTEVALQDPGGGPEQVLEVRPGERVERAEPGDAGRPASLVEGSLLTVPLGPGGARLMRLATAFAYPELPEPLATIAFTFDTPESIQGWTGFNGLADPRVEEGTLKLTVAGTDPFLYRDHLRVPADAYRTVRVRLKLPPCEPEGQLFWTTAAEPQFTDGKYLNFPVEPDGQWHEYSIAVSEHPLWAGQAIRGLRLDPTVGGAAAGSVIEVAWIRGE